MNKKYVNKKPPFGGGGFLLILSRKLVRHDEVEDEVEQEGMKVAHNDEAANNCDNAPELDLIVTLHAAGEIVGNSAMKFYHY